MNTAVVISACAFVLQLGLGALLLGVAKAPEWRTARLIAFLAFSAAAFSLGNVLTTLDPMHELARDVGSRLKYFAAALHVCGWLAYSHTTTLPQWTEIPGRVRSLMLVTVGVGVTSLLTGWHRDPSTYWMVEVPWAHVTYRLAGTTRFGEGATYLYLAGLMVVLVNFLHRWRAGERGTGWQLVGFSIFFACAVDEMLVANGHLKFFLLADVGFLAVMMPLTLETLRRFIDVAAELSSRTRALAGEVEVRTRERDEAKGALIEAERHASLGRLAAGVAHEINNPLTYLRLNIELLGEWARRERAPEEVRESVDAALDGSDRIRWVVDALRAYSKASTGRPVPMSPPDFVQSALRICEPRLQGVAVVERQFGITPTILGDEPKLVQVMVNLLCNAADALGDSPPADRACVMIRTGTLAEGDAFIDVIDNGPGISAVDLPRIMDPYFTTRAARGGTGLGLFLARATVDQHGGRLEITSEIGRGTHARVVLASAPSVVDRIAAEPPGSGGPHMGLLHDSEALESEATISTGAGSEDGAACCAAGRAL